MTHVCDLDHYGFLSITGKDAVKFLQGYTTCDLHLLKDSQALPGAVCNIQGRMLTSFIVLQRAEQLLLRMDRPLVTRTIDFLSKYIVFSKAELEDVSENLHCYGLLGCEQTPQFSVEITNENIEISLGERRELWLSSTAAVETDLTSADWLSAEIDSGLAWVTDATSEKFIPQMFNYHLIGAIDFDKGCYLGQEIVARMKYRGELKRRLHRLQSKTRREIGSGASGGGTIVASNLADTDGQLLAVLQNPEGDTVTVDFEDGEQVIAEPCLG